MTEEFEVQATFPVEPARIYKAWLDSQEHGAMTGSDAFCNTRVGADFWAWYGFIVGKNLELDENKRIVQSWRTDDFPQDAPDSQIEVILEDAPLGGTRLTLKHTGLPDGMREEYEKGWEESYFEPMQRYFGGHFGAI